MLEYLNEAFYKDAADEYYLHGIPPELEGELKGAEKDLIVQPQGEQADRTQQRLKYIGRKTIAKYGCFGCHDIPGFEDAKPIGTGWPTGAAKTRPSWRSSTSPTTSKGTATGQNGHGGSTAPARRIWPISAGRRKAVG